MIPLIGIGPKGIPFLQVQPGLPVVVRMIERPIDIEVLAGSFTARGGRYCLTLKGEELRLGAVVPHMNGVDIVEVASATAINGIVLPFVVDQLVRESVRKLDLVQ